MSKLSRDVGIAGAIAAGILVSLVLARLLTSDPTPPADQTAPTPSAADDWPAPDPTISSTRATKPSAAMMSITAAPPPAATIVLSSGGQVVPRPARPPQSYRPAPTGLPTTPPQPPLVTPDPAVYADPSALGRAWLAAMCWYDYRTEQDENTQRAAAFGDTSMPTDSNPWVLDDQAWTQITTNHLSSGCTDIAALPAHTGRDGTDLDTVTLTATQILMVDGAPYQAVPISLTRVLHHGPDGQWLIGPAVTAN